MASWSSAAVRGAAMVAVAILAAGAKRIVGVRPAAPGWTWPSTADESKVHDSGALSEWEDDDKLAHVDVALYRSASAAHHAMPAFDALSRRYARQGGYILGEESVSDLGDDAWRLRIGGNGPEVTYHWRRRNLVLEAHSSASAPARGLRRRRPRLGGSNRRRSTPRLTGDDLL